ncbi:hypothetical protein TNCV_3365311 [Trichonephila clavipes]|nr:hypothetical protein TNCV_3365311 [Trichonephila clavipes]
MSDLSDYLRSQVVGTRLDGANVTERYQLLGVSRGTVSNAMKHTHRVVRPVRQRKTCGRKEKIGETDPHCDNENGFIVKKQSSYSRVAILKHPVTDVNAKRHLQ